MLLFIYFVHSEYKILMLCPTDAVISPRHVEGRKLDRTVWNISTFHAYVSYHVKVVSFLLNSCELYFKILFILCH